MLESSSQRIEPGCPYFSKCGGCHYQHTSYDHQLEIKSAILKETLRRVGKLELESDAVVHPSPPWNYRNRTRFQIRSGGEFAAGYFEAGSHRVLPVEECPISSPLINRALAGLWALGRGAALPKELRAVELFADADDAHLQAEFWIDGRVPSKARAAIGRDLSSKLSDAIPEIISGGTFAETIESRRGAPPLPEKPDWTFGDPLRYRVAEATLRVSPASFFQVNRFLLDPLVRLVTANRTGELALDLYAGVGLFTVDLGRAFHHVVAVESSQSSAADLPYNVTPNTKVVCASVDAYLGKKVLRQRPDFVIVDPPRAGLGERVTRALGTLGAPRITYVSCDPATLARDLVQLKTSGYRIEKAHLVDLFPQTFHLETVVELAR
jgi:23S rRNA (uracil1939-C5)-methyltransferase